jgi:hypothetical protein
VRLPSVGKYFWIKHLFTRRPHDVHFFIRHSSPRFWEENLKTNIPDPEERENMYSNVTKKLLHWEELSVVDKVFLAVPRIPYMIVALLKPDKHMLKTPIKRNQYTLGLIILAVFVLIITTVNRVSEIPYYRDIAERAVFLKNGFSFSPWLALNLVFLGILQNIYKRIDRAILLRSLTYGLVLLILIHILWILIHSFTPYAYLVNFGVGPIYGLISQKILSWWWDVTHILLMGSYLFLITLLVVIGPLKAARSKSGDNPGKAATIHP